MATVYFVDDGMGHSTEKVHHSLDSALKHRDFCNEWCYPKPFRVREYTDEDARRYEEKQVLDGKSANDLIKEFHERSYGLALKSILS